MPRENDPNLARLLESMPPADRAELDRQLKMHAPELEVRAIPIMKFPNEANEPKEWRWFQREHYVVGYILGYFYDTCIMHKDRLLDQVAEDFGPDAYAVYWTN